MTVDTTAVGAVLLIALLLVTLALLVVMLGEE